MYDNNECSDSANVIVGNCR